MYVCMYGIYKKIKIIINKLTVLHLKIQIFLVWDHVTLFLVHDNSEQLHTFVETNVLLQIHVNVFVHVHTNEDHPVI